MVFMCPTSVELSIKLQILSQIYRMIAKLKLCSIYTFLLHQFSLQLLLYLQPLL